MSLDSNTTQAAASLPEESPQEQQRGAPPENRKRFDRVEAAIWRREYDNGESSFSVTFSRSYKFNNNGTEEWRRTSSWDPRDLPHLELALRWAMQELLMKPE